MSLAGLTEGSKDNIQKGIQHDDAEKEHKDDIEDIKYTFRHADLVLLLAILLYLLTTSWFR